MQQQNVLNVKSLSLYYLCKSELRVTLRLAIACNCVAFSSTLPEKLNIFIAQDIRNSFEIKKDAHS